MLELFAFKQLSTVLLHTEQYLSIRKVANAIVVIIGYSEFCSSRFRQLQRLTYVDDLDVDDTKRLSFYHVVPRATFKVRFWPEDEQLIRSAYSGDIKGANIAAFEFLRVIKFE